MAQTVHILHKITKKTKLGIVSPGIKVGRAVFIRKERRKRVGDKPVNSSHQHMIRQPFHQSYSFGPAIGTKYFTHGPSLFGRIQVGQGAAKLGKAKVEEFPVPVGGNPLVAGSCKTRHYLQKHHIHTGHILSPLCPEIVADAAAQPSMGIVVLNNMADVFHSAITAPAPCLTGKAFVHQKGYHVHVIKAYCRRCFSHSIPQCGKPVKIVLTPASFHSCFQLIAPGQAYVPLAEFILKIVARRVSKLRLI